MPAKDEPTKRAMQFRLNKAHDRIRHLEEAQANLLADIEAALERYRLKMGFDNEYPPTRDKG